MTPAGVFTGALMGCVLLIWVVNLIRNGRLYVGYGVIFVLGTLTAIVVLLVPRLLEAVTAASVALVPVPSLSIGAIAISDRRPGECLGMQRQSLDRPQESGTILEHRQPRDARTKAN